MLCAVRANCRTLQRPCLGAKRNALSQRFNSDPLTAAICAGIDSARQRQAARRPAASRPRTLRHYQSTAPAIIAYSNPAIHIASAAKPPVRTCRRHITNDVPTLSPARQCRRQIPEPPSRQSILALNPPLCASRSYEYRRFCCLGRQNCHIRTCRQSRHTGAILALST